LKGFDQGQYERESKEDQSRKSGQTEGTKKAFCHQSATKGKKTKKVSFLGNAKTPS
jgi:hypothetical protein